MHTTNHQDVEAIAQSQWSGLRWFGVVAGASVWMLCTGVFMIANSEAAAGMIPIASGLTTLAVGVALWSQRSRTSIHFAMIVLLTVTLFASSTAIALTVQKTSPELLATMKWPANPIPLIAFTVVLLCAGIWMNYSKLVRDKQG